MASLGGMSIQTHNKSVLHTDKELLHHDSHLPSSSECQQPHAPPMFLQNSLLRVKIRSNTTQAHSDPLQKKIKYLTAPHLQRPATQNKCLFSTAIHAQLHYQAMLRTCQIKAAAAVSWMQGIELLGHTRQDVGPSLKRKPFCRASQTHTGFASHLSFKNVPSLPSSLICSSCSINHFRTRWPAGCSAM